jgi:hypothetical protein
MRGGGNAILLRLSSLGEPLESSSARASTSMIMIGTLWPGEPARFNASAQRHLIGITILAAVSYALLMAARGS